MIVLNVAAFGQGSALDDDMADLYYTDKTDESLLVEFIPPK